MAITSRFAIPKAAWEKIMKKIFKVVPHNILISYISLHFVFVNKVLQNGPV